MKGRVLRFFALLMTASVLWLFAQHVLETMLENDIKAESEFLEDVRPTKRCTSPPSGWHGESKCYAENDGKFQQELWCRLSDKSKEPEGSLRVRPGRPTEFFPEKDTFTDGGWRDDWRIGLYEGSTEHFPFPRIFHPISVVKSCQPGKAGEGRKKSGPVLFVETLYIPDSRRELNLLTLVVLVLVFFYYSKQRERRRQVMAMRHDLRNMLQTLLGQLHRHIRDIRDEEARERMKESVEGNINDMLLVVDGYEDYRDPPCLLRLSSLLGPLVDGARDGRTEIAFECPDQVLVECWDVPLRRALENLIRNAREAAAQGIPGRVRIRVDRHGDTLRIMVENNGNFFPRHILRNFSNKLSLRVSGGFGLTVIREVVRRHGGRVVLRNVQASDDWTARVEISLPYTQENSAKR